MKIPEIVVRGTSSASEGICSVILLLVWHFLHLLANIWYLVLGTVHTLQSHLISTGLLKKYKAFDMTKLQYLAIVIDSEEAHNTARVIKLLHWLSNIGVKHICLYDTDGVLKKSKETILEAFRDATSWKLMNFEFMSCRDGKEGTAKAASFLCSEFSKSVREDGKEPLFTEADMYRALKAVGCGGPEPNLLLVYGPARCHLGFPSWRMRYTEIVHMGTTKSMKYGAIIKAIHKSAPELWYMTSAEHGVSRSCTGAA